MQYSLKGNYRSEDKTSDLLHNELEVLKNHPNALNLNPYELGFIKDCNKSGAFHYTDVKRFFEHFVKSQLHWKKRYKKFYRVRKIASIVLATNHYTTVMLVISAITAVVSALGVFFYESWI